MGDDRLLEHLSGRIAVIFEGALDMAVRRLPDSAAGRSARLRALADAGRDAALLAEAAAVLLRRPDAAHPGAGLVRGPER